MNATVFHRSQHLRQDELYDARAECPVCLSPAPRRPVFRLQTQPDVHMLACPHCQAGAASHMPHQAVLDAYYSHYYAPGQQALTCPNVDRLARHIAGYIAAATTRPPLRILDFGGGDGTLACRLAGLLLNTPAAIAEIDVVDYASAGASGSDRIRVRGHRSLDGLDRPYDVVLASAVLEHIPAVNAVMRRLFALVRPGGYFYARTPYVLPLARLVRRLDLTFPGHVHDMGGAFWSGVPETFGLSARVLASRPSPLETTFASHPARTLAAGLLKLPGWLEAALSPPSRRRRLWRLVGGWEVVLRFAEAPETGVKL